MSDLIIAMLHMCNVLVVYQVFLNLNLYFTYLGFVVYNLKCLLPNLLQRYAQIDIMITMRVILVVFINLNYVLFGFMDCFDCNVAYLYCACSLYSFS